MAQYGVGLTADSFLTGCPKLPSQDWLRKALSRLSDSFRIRLNPHLLTASVRRWLIKTSPVSESASILVCLGASWFEPGHCLFAPLFLLIRSGGESSLFLSFFLFPPTKPELEGRGETLRGPPCLGGNRGDFEGFSRYFPQWVRNGE